jgi:hypothetical protein
MTENDEMQANKPLARALQFKIAFTALFWCGPLLVFRPHWFLALGVRPMPQPMAFVRLLGAAYLALLVGYSFGLARLHSGQTPIGVVWTGIASNGLASAILFYYGVIGAWQAWGTLGRAYMWISAVVTLGITVSLLYYGRPWQR